MKRRIWHRLVRCRDAHRFVFLDESGANVTLVPRYGRAPKGQRCHGSQPRGRYQHLTLFASLTLDGITSAMILDGAADREAFRLYIERILVPTLRPRQFVILDNLSVHKQRPVRAAIAAAGCRVLFLPTYSPDFNPIELAFSKVKQVVRRAQARTTEALEEAIGRAIDQVTATDAAGFFRHCGYVPP